MGGLFFLLLGCATAAGLPQALRLEEDIDRDLLRLLPASWALAVNLIVAGAACVLVSRRQAGGIHLFRAAAGQGLIGLMLFFIADLAHQVRIGDGGSFGFRGRPDVAFSAFWIFVLGVLGILFLAWPSRQARPAADALAADPGHLVKGT
jgi:hypothetical protein